MGMMSLASLYWATQPSPRVTTLEVPETFPRIRDALLAAMPGDVIVVGPGTYQESLFLVGRQACASEERILVPSSVTVRTHHPKRPGDTFLQGSLNDAAITFSDGVSRTFRLEGFVIIGGDNTLGGGIRCEDSNPTIAYCHIARNRAASGGGIYLADSSPVLIQCSIYANDAIADGAGIYVDGTSAPILDNCVILDNHSLELGCQGRECFVEEGGSVQLIQTQIPSFRKAPMDSTLTFWSVEAGRPLLTARSLSSLSLE
jgi:hypothetical protein